MTSETEKELLLRVAGWLDDSTTFAFATCKGQTVLNVVGHDEARTISRVLREAAEWHDQQAANSRITVEHASRAELRKYAKASVYTHERSATEIRARIAALETEEGK